jgi:hypothetical protein
MAEDRSAQSSDARFSFHAALSLNGLNPVRKNQSHVIDAERFRERIEQSRERELLLDDPSTFRAGAENLPATSMGDPIRAGGQTAGTQSRFFAIQRGVDCLASRMAEDVQASRRSMLRCVAIVGGESSMRESGERFGKIDEAERERIAGVN